MSVRVSVVEEMMVRNCGWGRIGIVVGNRRCGLKCMMVLGVLGVEFLILILSEVDLLWVKLLRMLGMECGMLVFMSM